MNNTQIAPNPSEILSRAKLVLTNPSACWDTIASEQKVAKSILVSYGIPLIVVNAVVQFISSVVIGVSTPFGTFRSSFFDGLLSRVLGAAVLLFAIFVVGKVVPILAPKFGGSSDVNKATAWIVYSLTASVAASIVGLLPLGTLLSLPVALFGLYIIFQGINRMTGVQGNSRYVFFIVTMIATALIVLVPTVILTFVGLAPKFM